MLRCSGRIRRHPDHYEANIVILDMNNEDPITYKDAKKDIDKEKWHEAMNQE